MFYKHLLVTIYLFIANHNTLFCKHLDVMNGKKIFLSSSEPVFAFHVIPLHTLERSKFSSACCINWMKARALSGFFSHI